VVFLVSQGICSLDPWSITNSEILCDSQEFSRMLYTQVLRYLSGRWSVRGVYIVSRTDGVSLVWLLEGPYFRTGCANWYRHLKMLLQELLSAGDWYSDLSLINAITADGKESRQLVPSDPSLLRLSHFSSVSHFTKPGHVQKIVHLDTYSLVQIVCKS
jgi:hypothetical protein